MSSSQPPLKAVARPGFAGPGGLIVLLVLCAAFTACSRRAVGPPPVYAFIGFENLSGDPSLDWAALGASEFLSRSLHDAMEAPGGGKSSVLSPDSISRAGQPLGLHAPGAPGVSSERESAMVAGAARIVTGYIERVPAGIRITASEEDVATHRTLRTLSATASAAFEALNRLAHEFSASAVSPGTTNAAAFRVYATALGRAPADAPALLEQAVQLDPGFGRAWLLLVRTRMALGDHADAEDTIARARAQKIAPSDRAWLDFEAAAISGDRTASLTAMRKVSELEADDIGLARNLAEAETAAGNFSQAAAVWKRLTVRAPADVNAWNQLAYSLCWSGDYAGSMAALREYQRLRPNDGNAFDTQGDVQYWFAKFSDAAASYTSAYAKTPALLNGGDLYKAAWAKFRAGDKTGADTLFAKFRDLRVKAKDPGIDLLAAEWLYRTGRGKEGMDLLRKTFGTGAASNAPALRAEMAAQLAVWDLLGGDRAAAARDIEAGGTTDLTPSDVLVRFAVMPTAAPSEWETRAARFFVAPQVAALRTSAVGYALILDGRKQAAIPVWEEIVKQSPGTDFFARAVLARLKGLPVEHATPPDPANFNPFAVIPDKL